MTLSSDPNPKRTVRQAAEESRLPQESSGLAESTPEEDLIAPVGSFKPQPSELYHRLAYILVIGILVLILACICAGTAITLAFLTNPPW